jgi:hypothetical protein
MTRRKPPTYSKSLPNFIFSEEKWRITIYTLYICSLCIERTFWSSSNDNLIYISLPTLMVASLNSNTTVVTCGGGTASHSEYPSSPPVISGFCIARSLVFCVVFCRSLFVIVLSVLLLFIATDYLPLVSSNLYYISISYCKDNIKCVVRITLNVIVRQMPLNVR